MTEAIETSDSYVENTLGNSVETGQTTYMCVDPRIYTIYSAEDKGVANGYEPENIYFREYCLLMAAVYFNGKPAAFYILGNSGHS